MGPSPGLSVELVAQSRGLGALNQAQLTDLQKRLRARRDRVQRMIRTRTRNTEAPGPDTGARFTGRRSSAR